MATNAFSGAGSAAQNSAVLYIYVSSDLSGYLSGSSGEQYRAVQCSAKKSTCNTVQQSVVQCSTVQ